MTIVMMVKSMAVMTVMIYVNDRDELCWWWLGWWYRQCLDYECYEVLTKVYVIIIIWKVSFLYFQVDWTAEFLQLSTQLIIITLPPQTPTSSPKRSSLVLRSATKAARSSGIPTTFVQDSSHHLPPSNRSNKNKKAAMSAKLETSFPTRNDTDGESVKEKLDLNHNHNGLGESQTDVLTGGEHESDDIPVIEPSPATVMFCRSAILLLALAVYLRSDSLQVCINNAWAYLSQVWWFRTVYFETVWATVTYAYLMAIHFTMHFIPWFNRYKVHKTATYVHQVRFFCLFLSLCCVFPNIFRWDILLSSVS
jgi:hypothetical protein